MIRFKNTINPSTTQSNKYIILYSWALHMASMHTMKIKVIKQDKDKRVSKDSVLAVK